MSQDLVEGWTEPILLQLHADGAAPDLTGMTVELLLYKKDKALVEYEGTSGIQDPTEAKVYFHPTETDLLAVNSPYYTRWKVTDGAGDISYFPSREAEMWIVRKP